MMDDDEEGQVAGAKALLESWAKDAEKFVREALKVKNPTSQQKQALKEVTKIVWAKIKKSKGEKLTPQEEEYSKKVGISIMSGMGTGKDTVCSWVILWFLCCFPRPLIPCTAPTGHQLKDNLWREINKWRLGDHDDPPVIKEWITWQTEKIFFTPREGKDWFAVGRTANPKDNAEVQAETLKGFHEDYMMVVVDEGSAVPNAVFEPLEGTLTGKCNFMFLIFNPARSSGFAIETQTRCRGDWVCLHWDAEDSEIVTKESIESKANKFGRESNFFRVNVTGYPPISSDDTLIPYEWAINAVDRQLESLPEDTTVFGVDVGAGGDPSAIVKKTGPIIESPEIYSTSDSEVLTGWIMKRIIDSEPLYAFIDIIGVGWAVEGNLKSRLRGTVTNIIGIAVSEAASMDFRFHRLRDELAWRVRDAFEKGDISIPNDPMLIGELTTLKYTEPDGKIKVESKKELKKRGIASPNRFDALILAYYYDSSFTRRKNTRFKRSWRRDSGLHNWKNA